MDYDVVKSIRDVIELGEKQFKSFVNDQLVESTLAIVYGLSVRAQTID